jgi:hypothetical protein
MFSFKLTAILGIILFAALSGSVLAVKGMSSSKATVNEIAPIASPAVSPSPSLSPQPTSTPTPSPSPKPSIKPSVKPSPKVSPTPVPTPEIIITTTTTTVTTQTNNTPKLDSVDPSNPAFSAPMTLKGSNFGNQTGIINVYNSKGEPQPYPNSTSWSDTEIKTYSPFYASDAEYQIEITTSDGRKSNRLTIKSGGGQPQVDEISPSSVKPGDELTIKGSRYDSNPGKVDFYQNYPTLSGTGLIVSWSDSEIKVKIPSNLEAGKEYGIQVTNGRGGQSSFKYYTLGS